MQINIALLTITDSRTIETDKSGSILKKKIAEQNHKLVDRKLVKDSKNKIKKILISWTKMKKIDVTAIVKSVVDDFNTDLLNSKKNIKIKLNTNSDNKTKPNILGVGSRVEQVLANLLDNSISFSPPNSEIKVIINFPK